MNIKKHISDFRIIGTSVKNLNIKNNFIILNDEDKSIKRSFSLNHEIINISENTDCIIGVLDLNLKINISLNNLKTNIILLLEGCFSSSDKNKDNFEKMLEINGVTALYSIARSYILSISSLIYASGKITLPMLNVISYNKALNKKNDV